MTPDDPAAWRRREIAFPLLAPLADAVGSAMFRVDLDGARHLPDRGPMLVAANHISVLDPLLLFTVLHRHGLRPRFLALTDLWATPWLAWLLRRGRMIPVRRGGGAEAMVASACTALAAGQVVVLYPEGTVTPPHETPRARPGAGLLALRASAPVIPVAMSGVPTYDRGIPPLRTDVRVRIGPPVDLGAHRRTRDAQATADTIMAAIRGLLDG